MKKPAEKRGLRALIMRYRSLPRDLHSRKLSVKNRAQKLLALTICIPLMIWALGYMVSWEMTRRQIHADNAAFSALYSAATPSPAPAFTPEPTPSPTLSPTPTAQPTPEAATQQPTTAAPTAEPTPEPTAEPTQKPTVEPAPTLEPMEIAIDATLVPRATPDADTIVYAMETPPPVQDSFKDLLGMNPETIGFIKVGEDMQLPVVQRPNDNSYYLNHSFDHEESIGGTLFLDGSNLLVPEDASLIIYGHNMKNGTMFRPLIRYESLSYMKENPLVQFDTLYENRKWAPFAVFTLTADEGSERYLNIRQFMFDQGSWEDYIADMRALSVHSIPVEVEYGDRVLLLVTCEYTHNNGRFVVALRAQRDGETEDELIQRVQAAY